MYTVSRTFDNAEEANEAAALLFGIGGAAKPAKKKAAAKEPIVEDDEDVDLGLGDEDPADELTLEMVQTKVKDVVKAGKKPDVIALLKKFKAASVTELPETKYEAFMEGLSKIKLK